MRVWLIGHHHWCLVNIVDNENGKWDPTIQGGLPQAQPASKMSMMGSDWATNPFTQIRWMMWYVKHGTTRFHTECEAWRFKKLNGWY